MRQSENYFDTVIWEEGQGPNSKSFHVLTINIIKMYLRLNDYQKLRNWLTWDILLASVVINTSIGTTAGYVYLADSAQVPEAQNPG